jgi:hypothetical protein
MFEHLNDPQFTALADAEPGELISAQIHALDFLDDDAPFDAGKPLTPNSTSPRDASLARQAFASTVNPDAAREKTNGDLLKLKTPQAVRHLAGMLSEYDWDFVEQAKELRGYVVAKLLEETKHPDAKIRLKALELTGKLTEVGSFTERIQVTKVDATTDELQERIRAKLASLLPKVVEVQDVTPKADD